ncbi:hypothetical protein EV182_003572 [Spiromyces aspiralis]|uniref:Uncharacterized protein n=1 Tax=Spiromyces aspiralis TaxID=68401 RepID=A0ACC1HE78_9FUNG|nr:hypothetical protein EV182_003572 [Spiromyces aspiralis]
MASSCSFDGQVRLWDIRKYGVYSGGAGRTPAPVAMSAIAGNGGASRSRGVSSLAIDSLGTRIYVACGDNKVRVYNALRLGEPLATMTSPEFECNGFFVRTAVSPDDRFLAVGSSTGAVNVWELEPSKGIPMIARDAPLDLSKADVVLENAHTKEASCVAWRPTLAPDYQLLTCSDDGTIRTWNPRPRACAGCSLDEISAIYPDAKSQWGFARRS